MEETPSCLSFYASVGTVVERVVGKYRCRLLRYVVVTASKRNFLEILPLLSAPPPLPPLPSFVLTGVDARNTRVGGREGRRCLFSVRIHHEEEQKERRSGLSSKVFELLDAPTSFPLLLVLDYSLEGASGGRWSLSPSRSLSLFLPPLSDRRETNGVSRAVAANSRHSPNYKQYAARCV